MRQHFTWPRLESYMSFLLTLLLSSTQGHLWPSDVSLWLSSKMSYLLLKKINVIFIEDSLSYQFSSVQSLSCVWLFATPWTAACQASLSITNSQSLLKLISVESVMPSSHLILSRPLLLLPSIFPSIRVFSNEFFTSGGQSIGVSASASVLPMYIQDWVPLGWGLVGSPCSPRDSQESSPTPQFKSINSLAV